MARAQIINIDELIKKIVDKKATTVQGVILDNAAGLGTHTRYRELVTYLKANPKMTFENCQFDDLVAPGIEFPEGTFTNVSFGKAYLGECYFGGSTFRSTSFSGADVTDGYFMQSNADRFSGFSNLNGPGTDFTLFTGQGISLVAANLYGAKMVGADLQDANLYCAKLNGANLNLARLQR
ncbi:MAG: pentapeptide repeat-containing protein, partial [Bdellovibrionota bacterium]